MLYLQILPKHLKKKHNNTKKTKKQHKNKKTNERKNKNIKIYQDMSLI